MYTCKFCPERTLYMFFYQGICQREGARGEEAGVPEASEAAADRERAHWILGVDLQSRFDSSLKQCESWHVCVFVVLEKHDKLIESPSLLSLSPAAEEVLLEEEDEIAEEKSPLDGAWYKRKQNLPGENRAEYLLPALPWSIATGGRW